MSKCEMAAISHDNPYQCDKCGATNVVAARVIFQQGARAYSGTFSSGISKSHEALAAAPPDMRSYARPLLVWGIAICFTFFWGLAGLSRIVGHARSSTALEYAVAAFLIAGVLCLTGMILNFRKIASYNRDIYPQLHWQWEHTYICRRCGHSLVILS